ncbi:hypothetical protein [Paractinoplanes durhamensis]|uniref:Uncharacterized protein n=1 Tax=Paractinoplanes durhamensis TaxID=113563 RepID=A0ABQ3Z311_9ACTN|nr:hypothetical protein [Actinoplanes durhamensis]GIE04207.1 hypothetical protein Adu01nite_55570 [Actinoplanes durhamensis]
MATTWRGNLARLAAAVLIAAGAVGVSGGPAFAADVDFGISLSDVTLSAPGLGKPALFTLENHGTTRPLSVTYMIDWSGLDLTKVSVPRLSRSCPAEENKVTSCESDWRFLPNPGGTHREYLGVSARDGATGYAGRVTVSVKADGDAVAGNDSRTVGVTIADKRHGVDLRTTMWDVTFRDEFGRNSNEPIPPGRTSPLRFVVTNYGDLASEGVAVKIKLPEHTAFSQEYGGCVMTADRRAADCRFSQVLKPLSASNPTGDYIEYWLDLKVSADVRGLVGLGGGSVTVAAPDLVDSDLSDNTQSFAVIAGWYPSAAPSTSATTGPSGSPSASAGTSPSAGTGGQAGGDDDGGGLPITGPAGIAIGGAGAAILVAGIALVVAARRRRIRIEV